MSENTNTKPRLLWSNLSKYCLLTMALSFIGWVYEVGLAFFRTGRFIDSGFMTLPFCPIYGVSLMTTYFLLGTPNEGRGLLKNVHSALFRYLTYAAFAFLIPTLAELFVGMFFDKTLGVSLWSYAGFPINYHGYVCLPVSVLWSVLIFLFMKFVFSPLKKLFFRLPNGLAIGFAVALLVLTVADVSFNYANAWNQRR